MVCPSCGCEMAEGHLYCETCGNEIRIVPDFEPEIENSISEALSTVVEEIEESSLEEAEKKKEIPDDEIVTEVKDRKSVV